MSEHSSVDGCLIIRLIDVRNLNFVSFWQFNQFVEAEDLHNFIIVLLLGEIDWTVDVAKAVKFDVFAAVELLLHFLQSIFDSDDSPIIVKGWRFE